MSSICFYFQVHQPLRIKKYGIFNIGDSEYFNHKGEGNLNNLTVLNKVAKKCYLPANKVLLELLKEHPEFKVSFSFSGVFLEQCARFYPEVLDSFIELTETGRVEILSETYYHSLAFLYSREEFRRQVNLHKNLVKELFGQEPKVFRNTELIYNNDIAEEAEKMGFEGILSEGADHILGWRSPNFLYRPKKCKNISVLLKNYKLSDDIAFRFGEKSWSEFPLTSEKFGHWISEHNGSSEIINLFMDYETFGEHQWEDKGIFKFLRSLPQEILKHPDNRFVTPSEAVSLHKSVGEIDVPDYLSWADVERDLSAWRSNEMQHDSLERVYGLEEFVKKKNDKKLLDIWGKLQTSDHFYYMCTKWFADGDVHKYFNPYESPYEAFISFSSVLNDLEIRLGKGERVEDNRKRIHY